MLEKYLEELIGDYKVYIANKISNIELKNYIQNNKFDNFISNNPTNESDVLIIKNKNKTYTIIRYSNNSIIYDYILNNNSVRALTGKTRMVLTYEEKINNIKETLRKMKNKYNLTSINEQDKELIKQYLNEEIIIYTYNEENEAKIKLERIEMFLKQDGEEFPILILSKIKNLSLQETIEQYAKQDENEQYQLLDQIINSFRNINKTNILLLAGAIGIGACIKYKIFDD